MAYEAITGTDLDTPLAQLLTCEAIQPGSSAAYETCKVIYLFHPLGAKMVDTPIKMAQRQGRKVTIEDSPKTLVHEAYEAERLAMGVDDLIFGLASTARIYGIGSIVYGLKSAGIEPENTRQPINMDKLAAAPIEDLYFNNLDPLNTSGSLVLNQDPNAPDFQKPTIVTAAGQVYHRSRALVLMNERPIYIAYTGSAFGYVGRSVYQRALFPLKSFIGTMQTDDLVALKAGLLIAKMEQPGSIVDNIMQVLAGAKRALLKLARTGNVLEIGLKDSIETVDLQNIDKAMITARNDILKNISTAADMPAKLLENETFVEGFGEGTVDERNVAGYIDGIRTWLGPAYAFMDNLVQRRAWNRAFYATIQAQFPVEYGKVDYNVAFYKWQKSFKAVWPSMLIEPESEQAKAEDVKQKAILGAVEVLAPLLDPKNKTRLMSFAASNISTNKLLFRHPLEFSESDFEEYVPPQPVMAAEGADADKLPDEPRPFAAAA